MSSVKIYTAVSEDLSPPIQGEGFCVDMVRYSDYAALKAKCAALAAENGQMLRMLTDISENHDEYVNQDDYLYAGIQMDYVSEINAYVSRDVEAENPFKETDSFLAEVRAKGVEMFAIWNDKCIEKGDEYEDVLAEVGAAARGFAAKLRQDANTAMLQGGEHSKIDMLCKALNNAPLSPSDSHGRKKVDIENDNQQF